MKNKNYENNENKKVMKIIPSIIENIAVDG